MSDAEKPAEQPAEPAPEAQEPPKEEEAPPADAPAEEAPPAEAPAEVERPADIPAELLDVPPAEEKEEILKPEVMQDINDLWEVFVQEGTDTVDIKELVVMMKALDVRPDEEEINDLVAQADPNHEQCFTKDALVAIMEEKLRDVDTVEDLIEQFQLLDRAGSGKIPVPELKQYMQTLGRKFTDEEVQAFLKEADPKDKGECDIEKFAQFLCPPKPDK